MCGFAGIISERTDYHETIHRSADAIKKRGVTLHFATHKQESYAYARLPTDGIAIDTLEQMSSEQETFLFNGLITDTSQLVTQFALPEECSESDYLALREGVRRYDIDFLEHCEGMFAGVHITPREITLFRDTIGVKPLYYVRNEDVFAFASEVKALSTFGLPIHEVAPGTVVRVERPSFTVHTYHFHYQQSSSHPLKELLTRAVVAPTKRYLEQSNRDVAILLSGGVDSSIIGQLLANHLTTNEKGRIQAFCIGENEAPDVLTARKLAQHLGFPLTHVTPYTDVEALERTTNVVYASESPHARVAKVALLYDKLAKTIQDADIQVVIGGEGADELFFGYHRFIDNLTDAQTERCFREFYQKVFPHTLLQRFDRIFANHQIEGRVPYLNQAVVVLAQAMPTHSKVTRHTNSHISKLPLRRLAQEIGLPQYIYDREKVKMTAGATGKQNATAANGYLEDTCKMTRKMSFSEYITSLYREHFPANLLQPHASTEESLMKYVQRCHIINQRGE